jgi:hypothetical protein
LLVTDLLWAMTRPGPHAKPINRLQTAAFPLPYRGLTGPAAHHWRFASPQVRRCLLAAVLSLFGSSRIHSALHGRGKHEMPWQELLLCLSTKDIADLQRRSWYWPPAAHNALRRASQLPRNRQRLLRRSEAEILTI